MSANNGNALPPELLVNALGGQLVLKKGEIRAGLVQRIEAVEHRLAELKKRKAQIQSQTGNIPPATDEPETLLPDEPEAETEEWADLGGGDMWSDVSGDGFVDVEPPPFTTEGDAGDDLDAFLPAGFEPEGDAGDLPDPDSLTLTGQGDFDEPAGEDEAVGPENHNDARQIQAEITGPPAPETLPPLPDVTQLIDDANRITGGLL